MTEIQTNQIQTRPANAQTIIDQIGRWTLLEIRARDIVELVKINRREWTFSSVRFLENVYADQLAEVVERMVAA